MKSPSPSRLFYSQHKVLFETPAFQLYEKKVVRSSDQNEEKFFSLSSPDWVLGVPLTSDGDLVLIEQDRAGVEDLILEFPGGSIEERDTSRKTVQKEILEETGFQSDHWISLGQFWSNPAIVNNRIHLFCTLDAKKVQDQQLEAFECIRVRLTPLNEMPQLIENGIFASALSLLAYQLAKPFLDQAL